MEKRVFLMLIEIKLWFLELAFSIYNYPQLGGSVFVFFLSFQIVSFLLSSYTFLMYGKTFLMYCNYTANFFLSACVKSEVYSSTICHCFFVLFHFFCYMYYVSVFSHSYLNSFIDYYMVWVLLLIDGNAVYTYNCPIYFWLIIKCLRMVSC